MKKLKPLKSFPTQYRKIEGELMNKFKFINSEIFDVGDCMFVPEKLYNEVIYGNNREIKEINNTPRPSEYI